VAINSTSPFEFLEAKIPFTKIPEME